MAYTLIHTTIYDSKEVAELQLKLVEELLNVNKQKPLFKVIEVKDDDSEENT